MKKRGRPLFAALDVASGQIIGQCHRRHRAEEFRKFLDTIEANVPADPDKNDLAIHNEDPKPFVFTKTADEILDSIARF